MGLNRGIETLARVDKVSKILITSAPAVAGRRCPRANRLPPNLRVKPALADEIPDPGPAPLSPDGQGGTARPSIFDTKSPAERLQQSGFSRPLGLSKIGDN